MRIAADKNQFTGSHGKSNQYKHTKLVEMGHEVVPTPLPFGDYCLITDDVSETMKRRGEKLKKQDLIADIKLSIDSKKDLQEVCGNICGKSHERFRDEVILAQKMGARMVVLIEEKGFHSVEDVFRWRNPRMHRYNKIKCMHNAGRWLDIPLPKQPPTNGATLAKAMITMHHKYGIEWVFTDRLNSADKIVEILGEQLSERDRN